MIGKTKKMCWPFFGVRISKYDQNWVELINPEKSRVRPWSKDLGCITYYCMRSQIPLKQHFDVGKLNVFRSKVRLKPIFLTTQLFGENVVQFWPIFGVKRAKDRQNLA